MARGHIRERHGPTGLAWELRVYGGVDPRTGKERRITKTVRGTKKLAEKELTKLLGQYDEGHHTGPDATVATLLARYLEAGTAGWSAGTAREHRRIVNRYLEPELGKLTLAALQRRPEEIDLAYTRLLVSGGHDGKELSPATVRRVHVVLHAALQMAMRWNWIVANPADRTRPFTIDKIDKHPPTPAQLIKAMKILGRKDQLIYTIVVLGAITGARRGELLALRWANLDLDNGVIDVRRALAIGTGGVIDQPRTKTKKPRRFSIGPGTIGVLKKWRTQCAANALACGLSLTDNSYVFSSEPDGVDPWRPDSLSRRWRLLRERHKLGSITLKDLRDFVATQLLDHLTPVKTVQERLGHDRATTTLDDYAVPVAESDRVATALLERLIGLA